MENETPEDMAYEALLKRAKKELPEVGTQKSRFQMPPLLLQEEKRRTIIRNFATICDALNRESTQVSKYIATELGSPANYDETRLIIRSNASRGTLEHVFGEYVETYVVCKACHSHDTHLLKEGKIPYIKCDACGAKNSVRNA